METNVLLLLRKANHQMTKEQAGLAAFSRGELLRILLSMVPGVDDILLSCDMEFWDSGCGITDRDSG